jgi:hypothetical protein
MPSEKYSALETIAYAVSKRNKESDEGAVRQNVMLINNSTL